MSIKKSLRSIFEKLRILKPVLKVKTQSLVWADNIIHGPLYKRRVAEAIGEVDSLLDIGFGLYETMLKPHLLCRVKNYMGVDAYVGYVERARAAVSSGVLPEKCKFINERIEKCDFPARSFDVIYSSGTLGLVLEFPKVIEKCAEWLAPNGSLVFCLGAPAPSSKNNRIIRLAYRFLHPLASQNQIENGVKYWQDWNRNGVRNSQFAHLPGNHLIPDDLILAEIAKYFILKYSFGNRPFIDIITRDLQETRLPIAFLVKPFDALAVAMKLMDPTCVTYVFHLKGGTR